MSPERQEAPEDGWASLKVDELKEQLEARDLPKSGKKDELVARLEEHDAAAGAETERGRGGRRRGGHRPAAKPARRRGSAETSTERRQEGRRRPRRGRRAWSCARARGTCAARRARRAS